jgi:hypothetical protein
MRKKEEAQTPWIAGEQLSREEHSATLAEPADLFRAQS